MPYKDPAKRRAYEKLWRSRNIEKHRLRNRLQKRKERAQWTRERKDHRNKWEREWRAKNVDHVHEYHRTYARKWRREKRPLAYAATARWRKAHPDAVKALTRRQVLKKRYRLEIGQYDSLCQAQKGLCAICHRAKEGSRGKRLFVDHDHATGEIRGLLCHKCNTILGMADDSIETLQSAIQYILKPPTK